MARTTKKKETATPVVTRAEKKDAAKNLIRELLAVKPYKHNELLDAVAKLYTERLGGEDTENVNDVKGRIGSVLDIMKKESDVAYEGGMYALKARLPVPPTPAAEEKTKKPRAKKTAKAEETPSAETVLPEAQSAPEKAEKPAKNSAKSSTAEPVAETPVAEETPTAEPVAEEKPAKPKKTRAKKTPAQPVTTEVKPSADEAKPEEQPTPKKRGRKAKAKTEETPAAQETAQAEAPAALPVAAEEKRTPSAEKPVETPVAETAKPQEPAETPVAESAKPQEPAETPVVEPTQTEEKGALVVKPKGEVAKKEVMDVSFLLVGSPVKPAPKTPVERPMEKPVEKLTEKPVEKPAETPVKEEKKEEKKPQPTPEKAEKPKVQPQRGETAKKPTAAKSAPVKPKQTQKTAERALTADEKLREEFLKKLRSLGGDYFEYYSVYLLERYCMKNGRRLEGMRISGGDHDGGIDGEIELTDRFGFKETIYIQSKNWDPEKGDEKFWVVGETLLQQFLGACACRQAKDGKQSCRGIFVTTSRFTAEAKELLETMSDKLVGYDGNDLYEAAKECSFGLVKKNGEWTLDERLLSGTKAFFNM